MEMHSSHNLIFLDLVQANWEQSHSHISFPYTRTLKKKFFTVKSTKISRIQRRRRKINNKKLANFPMGNEHTTISQTKLEQRKPLCVHSPSVSSLYTCSKRQYPMHGIPTMWYKRIPIRNRAGTFHHRPQVFMKRRLSFSYFHPFLPPNFLLFYTCRQ